MAHQLQDDLENVMKSVESVPDTTSDMAHPRELWLPENVYDKDFVNPIPKGSAYISRKIQENRPFHLLFAGPVGTGKSIMAKIIKRTYHRHAPCMAAEVRDKYLWYDVKLYKFYKEYLVEMQQARPNPQWLESVWKRRNLIVDDLGDERPDTTAAREYVAGLITERYEQIMKGQAKRTVITTNLNYQEVKDRYGSRITDRINEVFTIVKFPNESFRKGRQFVIEE